MQSPTLPLDNATVAHKIDEFIRPTTFPVAVRFLRKGEAPPPKARRPLADMQKHVTVCQGWAIARRYGWTTVLRPEDMKCPLGALVAGFAMPNEWYDAGNLCAGMYTADTDAGARSEASVAKLSPVRSMPSSSARLAAPNTNPRWSSSTAMQHK